MVSKNKKTFIIGVSVFVIIATVLGIVLPLVLREPTPSEMGIFNDG